MGQQSLVGAMGHSFCVLSAHLFRCCTCFPSFAIPTSAVPGPIGVPLDESYLFSFSHLMVLFDVIQRKRYTELPVNVCVRIVLRGVYVTSHPRIAHKVWWKIALHTYRILPRRPVLQRSVSRPEIQPQQLRTWRPGAPVARTHRGARHGCSCALLAKVCIRSSASCALALPRLARHGPSLLC